MFLHPLSEAKSHVHWCALVCVCPWAKTVLFIRECVLKGRCLYQFTTAPELMLFRGENKAVHFNGMASGLQRPALHRGATVDKLYVCDRYEQAAYWGTAVRASLWGLSWVERRAKNLRASRKSLTCLYLTVSHGSFCVQSLGFTYTLHFPSCFKRQPCFQLLLGLSIHARE